MKSLWFKLIRRWVLAYDAFKSVDPNEEFKCGNCLKPVLRRSLYCSSECYLADEAKQRIEVKPPERDKR